MSAQGGLLADKVVVVSGVGPGLGRSICLRAAAEGARVVLAADGACYEAKSAGRNRVVLARGPARVLPVRPAEPAGDAA